MLIDTRRFVNWIEFILVVSFLTYFFVASMDSIEFHGDESQWISTSYYFEAFINGKIHSPVWNESFWTLTQPPVTRYIIGIGRRAGGFSHSDLNKPWDFEQDKYSNIKMGANPSPSLLWWSRFPMALLASVSIFIIFKIMVEYRGRMIGYITLLLFLLNPYTTKHLCRATGESPVLFSVVFTMLVSIQALKSWKLYASSTHNLFKSLIRPFLWFMLIGFISGVGAASKLIGFATIAGGMILSILAPLAHKGNIPQRARLIFITSATIMLPIISAITFIGLNPYLYSKPVVNTIKMIKNRFREIKFQQAASPAQNLALHKRTTRIKIVLTRIFKDYSTMRFKGSFIINVLFFSIGLMILIQDSCRWLKDSSDSTARIVILLLGITLASPALFTPLDWDRYYLFPMVFSTICIAIGISFVIVAFQKLINDRIYRKKIFSQSIF